MLLCFAKARNLHTAKLIPAKLEKIEELKTKTCDYLNLKRKITLNKRC